MRLKIWNIFADFGSSRRDQNNVIEIREIDGDCRILLGLLGETFDSALTFYIAVIAYMMQGAQSNIVEFSGWNVRRHSKHFVLSAHFLSKSKLIYTSVAPGMIGQLMNVMWLASTPRIVGLKSSFVQAQADFLAHSGPHRDSRLTAGTEFVIEKKSIGVSDFLSVLCCKERGREVIEFLHERSVGLTQPLVETRLPL